jgi:hypothetical protein
VELESFRCHCMVTTPVLKLEPERAPHIRVSPFLTCIYSHEVNVWDLMRGLVLIRLEYTPTG